MAVDGNALRFYRLQKGLTMEEAARELGISRQTLQKYEQKTINLPITVFIKMAKLYDIDSFTLFGVEEVHLSDFEFDISPYYLIKLYAQLQIKAEIKQELEFAFTEVNTAYYAKYFKATVNKYITTISRLSPNLREDLQHEFAKDTDFKIN